MGARTGDLSHNRSESAVIAAQHDRCPCCGRRRTQRDRILDAWQAGEKASVIAAQLGLTANTVHVVAAQARKRGDPRAVLRRPGPRPRA